MCGVIVDVDVTTSQQSEGIQLSEQLKRIETNTGKKIKNASVDSAYAHDKNFEHLEEKGIDVIIPPQNEHNSPRRLPSGRQCRRPDKKFIEIYSRHR